MWNTPWRVAMFFLSATSIWCLLAEFYGLCSMRTFTFAILFPATALIFILAALDWRSGDRTLARWVLIGAGAGLLAAVAYDIFRLPFVFAKDMGIEGVVPAMPLFKVFPRFGALIMGEPVEQPHYSLATQLVGWAYHFSNGITFGIMYLALIGDSLKRSWIWGVVLAVGLELGMLFTPYTSFFGIKMSVTFVVVTLVAHFIFGVALGLCTRSFARRWVLAI